MIARFTIAGPPRTKKNSSRILRMGRFKKVMPSAAFMAWQKVALEQLGKAWAGRSPICQPVLAVAAFYRDANRGDLLGYQQALADVLEKAGVVKNDALIVGWPLPVDGLPLRKDAARPRVVVELVAVAEMPLVLGAA